MLRFFRDGAGSADLWRRWYLGPLERRVMNVLWKGGECSVRGVVQQLGSPLAYTTVMTTLDRLYKKGFLDRRKSDRAFYYSPRVPREVWERKLAGELVQGFLTGPSSSGDGLLSFLLDAVGQHDEALLEELERKVRQRRKELARRSRS